QTLHQTLRVIQTIDSKSDSDPARNTETPPCASHKVFDLHRLCEIRELAKVHTDRTSCQSCLMPAVEHNRLRRIDGDGSIQEFRHTICKCRRIGQSLEGETIGGQKAFDQLPAFRQNAEYVRSRPGNMPEMADGGIW